MAARVTCNSVRGRLARATAAPALAALVAISAVGCVPDNRAAPPRNDDPAVVNPVLPTPQRTVAPQIAATAQLVTQALNAKGLRMAPAVAPYRPSEPPGLTNAPRAVYQVDLGVPDLGYVVVYEFADPATSVARGQEMARYLASGFGQTNYPLDAQFALSQVGGTLVFTWTSASRATDDERARAAFDAVAGVGQPIPVLK